MACKILIVEDDEPILDLMDLLIRKLGHEPVLVSNGPDALAIALHDPPALILLDIMMTPINGWEFLEKIRAEPALKAIPVIIFSASPTVVPMPTRIESASSAEGRGAAWPKPGGRCFVSITGPSQTITARSSVLRSSRTFPGHE